MCEGILKAGQLCRTCYEKTRECFPSLTKMSEVNDFLWSATAYPMAECERVCKQLTELGRRADGDCRKAVAIVDQEMREEMDRIRPELEKQRLEDEDLTRAAT